MTALTRLSLGNRLIVGLAALAIMIFGVISALSLKQELLPSTQVPTAVLTATYPGASPDIVSKEVAKPLSQAISGISGVTKVRASSTNGLASLTVEWDYGLDNDDQVTKIRTAADGSQLPDVVDYDVMAGSTDDIPVLVLGVASDAKLPVLAQKVDDQVVPALSGITGVRQVQVSGEDTTELLVTLRPDRLRHYDLTAAAVTQALTSQATVVPAGNSYKGSTELAIQVGQTPTTARQVSGWYVPATDGPVKLASIADVVVRSVDATTVARSGGRPALSLSILKESGADSVELSHTIRDMVPALNAGLGANASTQVVFDQAPSIEKSIHDLAIEGGLGLIFAVLIILVFLMSVRSTIITAISIPLSLLIALIGLRAGDFSLNIFTLAAMTVAVGRVVDDSIVVVENIKRHDVGPGPLTVENIITSVREVATAVTASTLTTVAVFLPVAIVSGITGELFRPFSTTVAIALVASLLVSMTIVPVLAFWFLNGRRQRDTAGRAAAPVENEERVTRLQHAYLPVLNLALRRPLISLILAVVIFAGTMGSATLLKTNFLDSFADKATLQIDQELPVGTRLSTTSAAAKKVEAVLASDTGVKEYLTTVGQGGSNKASFFVSLVNEDAYETTLPNLKEQLGSLTGAGDVKVGSINTGTNNDVSYTVTGDDPDALEAGAGQVENALTSTPGLTEVTTDLSDRRPQLDITVDRKKAAKLGFTQAEVGQAIANSLTGTKVGTIELSGKNRDITVRTQDAGSDSPKAIGALELPVSQLQQQQATDKATDKLERKSDKLKAQGDDLTDAGDALGDRQENLGDRQKAYGDAQQVKANKATKDGIVKLRKQRTKAEKSVAAARKALHKVQAHRPPKPDPTDVTDPTQLAPVTIALQRYQQWFQQVAQLQAGVSQAKAGVSQLDTQVKASEKQQRESLASQSTQQGFTDETQNLTDEQKDLTDAQKKLGDKQSDLADDQKDIADVRAKPIRVRDIASVTQRLAPSTVTQIDGTRAVTLTATPASTDNLGAITKTVQSKIDALHLPAGVTIETGGASQDQADAFRQLGLAMLLAIMIVFIIMVATFRSLILPLILLSAIPFAATGAVAALLVTGTPLGVPAMVGLLMLIGIVVTNAIVLIDLINRFRARGEDVHTAVVDGARLRLRPIIMTATATICALAPMGLGLTGGGAFIGKPLAVVVIGGLVSSTLLTLLLVPVLYTLSQRRGERKQKARAQAEADAEADADTAVRPAI